MFILVAKFSNLRGNNIKKEFFGIFWVKLKIYVIIF
jgi:hypothetical protein